MIGFDLYSIPYIVFTEYTGKDRLLEFCSLLAICDGIEVTFAFHWIQFHIKENFNLIELDRASNYLFFIFQFFFCILSLHVLYRCFAKLIFSFFEEKISASLKLRGLLLKTSLLSRFHKKNYGKYPRDVRNSNDLFIFSQLLGVSQPSL